MIKRGEKMSLIKLGCDKIYYGADALQGIKNLTGDRKKAMIIMSGDILEKVGSLKLVTKELESNGFEWEYFDEVEPEPSFETVMAGVERLNEFNPDWIIGFGGGSAMDAAKAMWVFYENPEYQTIEDALPPNEIAKIGTRAKMCCIPTSSGTGSEATRAALIKAPSMKRKYSIRDLNGRLIPNVAILFAEFTKTMPESLAAASGMDSLTHAIESYTCINSNPFSQTLALGSFLLGYRNIKKVFLGGNDDPHSQMLAASCLGGIAFSNSALGIVHSIAHAFGAQYNIPHGLANGIILPYGIQFNEGNLVTKSQYQELAYFIKKDSLLSLIHI